MSAWEIAAARVLNAVLGSMPRVSRNGFFIGTGHRLLDQRTYPAVWPTRGTEHTFICGRTGMGKTTMMLQLMHEHLRCNRPFLFIDFHGHATRNVLNLIASRKEARCLLVEPWSEPVLGWNPLATESDRMYAAIGDLVSVFHHRLWPDAWGPRLEEILRMTLLALATANLTLVDVNPFLSQPEFRRRVLSQTSLPEVREFWTLRFERLAPSHKAVAIEAVLNKMAVFQEPLLRAMLGQHPGSLDLDAVFRDGQTVLVNLAAGHLHGRHYLIAALLVAHVKSAVYRRAARSRPYAVFLDEFQEMLGLAMLDDALRSFRKFGCSLYLATQHLEMEPALRAAIFGNCARLCAFAVSAKDATTLGQEIGGADGKIAATLLPDLPRGHVVIKRRGHPVEQIRIHAPEARITKATVAAGRELCLAGGLNRGEVDQEIADRRRIVGQRVTSSPPEATARVFRHPESDSTVSTDEGYADF